jgi:3-hydroxyisobutyrate dehydrogenase-like beta-hydroxyacid dehydrogenase
MNEKVGFVGLGNMGLPMSLRLLEASHSVVGFDVNAGPKSEFCSRGGAWASSPADVASQCSIVLASLPTPAVVEQVALGKDGLISGSAIKIFVDLSTTGPEMAKRVAQQLKSHDIISMDAPVSGGIAGAGKGTLSVMTSGPKAGYDKVKELLGCFGKNVFYVGEAAGAGQLMKLINNLLSATTLAASCEALCVGMKGGLDPEVMLTVLNASTGRSGATDDKIPRYVLPGIPINFGLDLSFKDVSLCVEAGEALQVPMYVGRTIRQIWHHAMSKGGPDQDMMDVSRCIEDWAGVKLSGSKPKLK